MHSDLGLVGDLGADSSRGRHRHRHRRETSRPALPRSVIAFAVVLLMLGGLGSVAYYGGSRVLSAFRSTPDYRGAGSGSVIVQVRPGDTASDIAQTLAAKDVVKSAKAFVVAADADARSRSLQPGTYRLHEHMSAALALRMLLDPASRMQSRIAVPEGFTVAQILARISHDLDVPMPELQAAAKDPSSLDLPAYARGRLEGFLYPATYTIEPGTPPTDALRSMVAKFNEVAAAENLERRAAAMHLTAYQVVIVASLLQREARVDSDSPKIARVIYNRLAAGIPLGIDASTLYGLGRSGGPLSAADLAKLTPYNLRKVKGLPPTPIASPGRVAIEAALSPAAGNWLYYVVMDKQGHHFFTNNYDAFLAQKAKSQREGLI